MVKVKKILIKGVVIKKNIFLLKLNYNQYVGIQTKDRSPIIKKN